MYVYGILKNSSGIFVIGVYEELQTLIVTAVDNGAVPECRAWPYKPRNRRAEWFFYARVADCTVAVGIEMRAQVSATHSTL